MSATPEQTQAFKGYLEISDVPNFSIVVEGFHWRVHGRLFADCSPFFKAIIDGAFKESLEQKVVLQDDCPWIVARMIQYIYFGIYDVFQNIPRHGRTDINESGRTDDVTNLSKMMQVGIQEYRYEELRAADNARSKQEISALMYKIADKYGLNELRSAAARKIQNMFYWDLKQFFLVTNIIGMEALHGEAELLKSVIRDLCENTKVHVFDNDDFMCLLGVDPVVTRVVIEYLRTKNKEMGEKQEQIVEVNRTCEKEMLANIETQKAELKAMKRNLQEARVQPTRDQIGSW